MKAFERSIAKAHPKLLLRFSVALGFAALTGVCSNLSFHLGFTPVPVTLQVFAVILSGMVLGSRWGAICQL